MKNRCELLAPAGSFESLKAAVQNGADAIYLGGEEFSARASAKNFSREELAEAVFYAHLRGVKIFVTVNTVLNERELESSIDYISYLYKIGVDAVIVQDLGLAYEIRKKFPDLDLHASTQMTVNNLEGAKLLESYGFTRIVLARETILSEIKLISENTSLEIESFGHGALCVSVSGQCLMSSMIGGRSGNRGRCAQSCRKSYEVVKPDGELLNYERAYLLSPMDLYTLKNLDILVDSGVNSIKIEGRMKRPDYVATVTKIYRDRLDGIENKNSREKLKQAYNRGFTTGLQFDSFGEDFVNTSRPDNRGIEVGRVLDSYKKSKLEIYRDLGMGDLLEFDTHEGRKTYILNSDITSGKVSISLPFTPIEKSEIRRIKDENQINIAKSTYEENEKKADIDILFYARVGENPLLKLNFKDIEVVETLDEVVEEAKKAPMSEEDILKQLSKLGDSEFSIGSYEFDIDKNIFIRVSSLNELRRNAIKSLESRIRDSNERDNISVSIKKPRVNKPKSDIKFSISISETYQLKDIDFDIIDRFYLRFIDKDIYSDLKSQGKEVFYRSPKILYNDDYTKLSKDLEGIELDGVVVDNIGSVEFFKDYKKIADMGLNIFNSHAIDFLDSYNFKSYILSPELNLSQIEDIRRTTDAEIEAIGYGFLPVMTMVHCPFSTIKKCGMDRNCETCQFRQGYSLRDEKNVDFRTYRKDDISTIYNAYPISMIDYISRLESAGIDYLLLDFSFEDNISEIISEFKCAKYGIETDLNQKLKDRWKNITYGHYFRGV